MIKYFLFSIFFIQIIFANEIDIKPKVDLRFYSSYKDAKFTTLGEMLNKTDSKNNFTSAFGGDFGFVVQTDTFDM